MSKAQIIKAVAAGAGAWAASKYLADYIPEMVPAKDLVASVIGAGLGLFAATKLG